MAEESQGSEHSLYRRLGGYDTIAAIIDDILRRLKEDPRFSRFQIRSDDSRRRARQLFVDQMCALTGGPCLYTGRDMKSSHSGLGITAAEWDASMAHSAAALKQRNIPEQEQKEFLALFAQYRDEIIDRAAGN